MMFLSGYNNNSFCISLWKVLDGHELCKKMRVLSKQWKQRIDDDELWRCCLEQQFQQHYIQNNLNNNHPLTFHSNSHSTNTSNSFTKWKALYVDAWKRSMMQWDPDYQTFVKYDPTEEDVKSSGRHMNNQSSNKSKDTQRGIIRGALHYKFYEKNTPGNELFFSFRKIIEIYISVLSWLEC